MFKLTLDIFKNILFFLKNHKRFPKLYNFFLKLSLILTLKFQFFEMFNEFLKNQSAADLDRDVIQSYFNIF